MCNRRGVCCCCSARETGALGWRGVRRLISAAEQAHNVIGPLFRSLGRANCGPSPPSFPAGSASRLPFHPCLACAPDLPAHSLLLLPVPGLPSPTATHPLAPPPTEHCQSIGCAQLTTHSPRTHARTDRPTDRPTDNSLSGHGPGNKLVSSAARSLSLSLSSREPNNNKTTTTTHRYNASSADCQLYALPGQIPEVVCVRQ